MPRKKKELPNHGTLHEIKITIGKNPDGSLIRKSFYSAISRDDARKKAEEYRIMTEAGNITGEGYIERDLTFAEWAHRWLESYKRPAVKEQTYNDTYVRVVEAYLLPYFGKMKLRDIKPVHISDFYTAQAAVYYESTLSKMRLCLNGIFNSAIDNGLCTRNPARSVKFTVVNVGEQRRVYTPEQYETVREFALSHRFGLAILLMLDMGLRRSEAVALQWMDIDLAERTLSVRQAATEGNGGAVLDEPKTFTSKRTLPIPPDLCEYIADCKRAGKYTADEHYVICGREGALLRPVNFAHRRHDVFMRELTAAHPDIPALTPHELRHTCGTRLYRETGNIYAVSKFLGHADLDTTVRIYVHNDVETLRKDLKFD